MVARDVDVSTGNNPWTEPPADVLQVGLAYAASFLKDLEDFGRTSSNRLKVVLVGLGNAGKTSVAVRLEGLAPSKPLPSAKERTVGVEIRDIRLGSGPANARSGGNAELDVKLWDFAGQRAYYDTHQMFLTPGALFVLVVDMFAYSEDGHSREDALEQWLDILQARVPGSVVLLMGTHSDSFDSPAECSKRVDCFVKGELLPLYKNFIMKRIGDECKAAADRGHAGVQDNRRYEPLRVVVVKELLALNLSPSGGVTTAELREHIEGVAYGVHDGYSFPSVNNEVPEPHLLAVATLEAVRRGVSLRGSGGEPAEVARRLNAGTKVGEGHPFVLFPEALSRFLEVAGEKPMFGGKATEGARVFLAAIKLHEVQGAILLTRADGGGEMEDMASEEHLVIHMNPAWFADLIRRIVDVRLLDPAQARQEKVADLIKRQPPASVGDLSKQHHRFFLAGELNRRYMRFLWKDRDLELGPASPNTAPPLEMSEEDITTIVESLLDVRFMFRVRQNEDHYIVPSCLPDHVGCDMDPKKLMELEVGGAIFSRRLEFVGAHSVPPGLIPRLLAWCGQGDERITACWKRGVCFSFKEHLVLLYEHRDAGRAVIECHAMGSAHDEKAWRTLEDVVTELGQLVGDAKYGFPGVGLFFVGGGDKQKVSSAETLEGLLTRFTGELKEQINVKVEELGQKLDDIAGGVEKHLRKGQEEMASLREDVSLQLDCIAAVTSECLLVSAEKDIPCPRLIMVSEDDVPESDQSRLSHFRREMMDQLFLGKGQTPQHYRIRFLCAYDLSAATCGEDGLGYKVEIGSWKGWLQKYMPVIQVALWTVRVGVSVVSRADILPVDDVMGKLREVAGEEAATMIGEIDVRGHCSLSGQDLVQEVDRKAEVFGSAFNKLADWAMPLVRVRKTGGDAAGGCAVGGVALTTAHPLRLAQGAERRLGAVRRPGMSPAGFQLLL
ncbi:unnamed protein product [Ectocarpus sp. CCAP 1310/34]|nr:unnamed protein product [Ectocarpus sp. CCAP 1310/34]